MKWIKMPPLKGVSDHLNWILISKVFGLTLVLLPKYGQKHERNFTWSSFKSWIFKSIVPFLLRNAREFCFVLIWGGGQGWNLEIEKGKRTGRRGSDRDMAKARQLNSWLWGLWGNHMTGRFGTFTFYQLNSSPALDSSDGSSEKLTRLGFRQCGALRRDCLSCWLCLALETEATRDLGFCSPLV